MDEAHRIGAIVLAACVAALGCRSTPPEPPSATPTTVVATSTPAATATGVVSPTITAPPPRSPSPSPVAIRTAAAAEAAAPDAGVPSAPSDGAPVAPDSGAPSAAGAVPAPPGAEAVAPPFASIPTAQPVAPRAPRAFRTPERAGDPAFVPPQGGTGDGAGDVDASAEAAAAPNAAGQRGSSGVVIVRATARTAVEGFDVRVTYPQSLGRFAATDNQADCTGGAGAFVTASDRATGELRLLVASAQALTFPFDVFCRFSVAPGARLDAGDFAARVAEVSSDGKKADPGLVVVDVVVR